MKKSTLIITLCALVAVAGAVLAIVIGIVFTDIVDKESNDLVISSASAVGIYNAEPLSDERWALHSGTLKTGHTLDVKVSGSQTDVGICQNALDVKVYDKNGRDVTKEYDLVLKPGTLNVKHRAIGVIAESDVKMYDGQPLVAEDYTLDSSLALVHGHRLEVVVLGNIINVGTAKSSVVSVVIFDADGNDVTDNYNVKKIDGELKIYSETALVFKSDDASKEYDGNTLTEDDWSMVNGTLKPGHDWLVTVSGKQTEVGASENTIQVKIVNGNGKDVSGEYEIICIPGKLTVLKTSITITTATAEKTFDGQPLVSHSFEVAPQSAVANGVKINPIFTGVQINAGNTKNTIEVGRIYDANGKDITDNFNITVVEGTLTVHVATN